VCQKCRLFNRHFGASVTKHEQQRRLYRLAAILGVEIVFGFRNYVSSLPKVPVEAKNSPNRQIELPEKWNSERVNFCRLIPEIRIPNSSRTETKYEYYQFQNFMECRKSGDSDSGIWNSDSTIRNSGARIQNSKSVYTYTFIYMRRSVFGFRNYVSSLPKVPMEAKNSPNRECELPGKYNSERVNFCRLLEFH
jgi:hypothetical protein